MSNWPSPRGPAGVPQGSGHAVGNRSGSGDAAPLRGDDGQADQEKLAARDKVRYQANKKIAAKSSTCRPRGSP